MTIGTFFKVLSGTNADAKNAKVAIRDNKYEQSKVRLDLNKSNDVLPTYRLLETEPHAMAIELANQLRVASLNIKENYLDLLPLAIRILTGTFFTDPEQFTQYEIERRILNLNGLTPFLTAMALQHNYAASCDNSLNQKRRELIGMRKLATAACALDVYKGIGCTATARIENNQIELCRNLDWQPLNVLADHTIAVMRVTSHFDAKNPSNSDPQKPHATYEITFTPGIMGLSIANDKGLVITLNEVATMKGKRECVVEGAIPQFQLIRDLANECCTVEQVREYLKTHHAATSHSLTVIDAQKNGSVFEFLPPSTHDVMRERSIPTQADFAKIPTRSGLTAAAINDQSFADEQHVIVANHHLRLPEYVFRDVLRQLNEIRVDGKKLAQFNNELQSNTFAKDPLIALLKEHFSKNEVSKLMKELAKHNGDIHRVSSRFNYLPESNGFANTFERYDSGVRANRSHGDFVKETCAEDTIQSMVFRHSDAGLTLDLKYGNTFAGRIPQYLPQVNLTNEFTGFLQQVTKHQTTNQIPQSGDDAASLALTKALSDLMNWRFTANDIYSLNPYRARHLESRTRNDIQNIWNNVVLLRAQMSGNEEQINKIAGDKTNPVFKNDLSDRDLTLVVEQITKALDAISNNTLTSEQLAGFKKVIDDLKLSEKQSPIDCSDSIGNARKIAAVELMVLAGTFGTATAYYGSTTAVIAIVSSMSALALSATVIGLLILMTVAAVITLAVLLNAQKNPLTQLQDDTQKLFSTMNRYLSFKAAAPAAATTSDAPVHNSMVGLNAAVAAQ